MTRCLQKEKEKRPTAAQLLEHRFLRVSAERGWLASMGITFPLSRLS